MLGIMQNKRGRCGLLPLGISVNEKQKDVLNSGVFAQRKKSANPTNCFPSHPQNFERHNRGHHVPDGTWTASSASEIAVSLVLAKLWWFPNEVGLPHCTCLSLSCASEENGYEVCRYEKLLEISPCKKAFCLHVLYMPSAPLLLNCCHGNPLCDQQLCSLETQKCVIKSFGSVAFPLCSMSDGSKYTSYDQGNPWTRISEGPNDLKQRNIHHRALVFLL